MRTQPRRMNDYTRRRPLSNVDYDRLLELKQENKLLQKAVTEQARRSTLGMVLPPATFDGKLAML